MNNGISVNDILDELQKQFPKELTIAVQAVQIRTMQEAMNNDEPEISQESE